MITDARELSLPKLKCKSRIEGGHRWVATQRPPDLFIVAAGRAGTLIVESCTQCRGWRHRHLNVKTGDWMDTQWRYFRVLRTHGLEPRDFRRELMRRDGKRLAPNANSTRSAKVRDELAARRKRKVG